MQIREITVTNGNNMKIGYHLIQLLIPKINTVSMIPGGCLPAIRGHCININTIK